MHLQQVGDRLEYRANTELQPGADVEGILRSYFRLDEDITSIHRELSRCDDTMARLVKQHGTMRVLHHPDAWETTVSYICSAQRGPRHIAKMVEGIAAELGHCVELEGDTRRTFPSQSEILAGHGNLDELHLGHRRAQHIVGAAKRTGESGLKLERLAEVDYVRARWELDRFDGIAGKIADCIALFALGKLEAFPVDRRVRRALETHKYGDTNGVSGDTLAMWGQRYFGDYAGYASQLLYLDGGQ